MRRLVIKDTKTMRRRIYEYLREQLLNGEIAPREHLIEGKIAKEIGTSRTPVREALHGLELEGLIESIPRVGYVVKAISEQEVEEICEIRMAIEGVAARWAMEKDHPKLMEELKKNISLSNEKVSKGDARAFIDLDARFHEIIAKHSGSQRLLELAQNLRRHMLRYRLRSIYSMDNVVRAIKGHKGILRAIQKGDIGEVNQAIRGHMEQVKKDVLRYAFKETGFEGSRGQGVKRSSDKRINT
ncbi:MAG: GntR family transcriptional regulator [Syntrophaceae bacterium]|nr:GntR family transcriptional regulator [Syntrophaceae bacterium]